MNEVTPMAPYDACMAAADHMVKPMTQYEFFESKVPNTCGSPACVLGWVGYFGGMAGKALRAFNVANEFLDVEETHFYDQMTDINAWHFPDGDWQTDPVVASACLRIWAKENLVTA